jgi:hypothetical protein
MQHFTISPFLQIWQVHDAYTQLDGTQVPGDHRPGAQLIEMEKLVLECKWKKISNDGQQDRLDSHLRCRQWRLPVLAWRFTHDAAPIRSPVGTFGRSPDW